MGADRAWREETEGGGATHLVGGWGSPIRRWASVDIPALSDFWNYFFFSKRRVVPESVQHTF